MKQLSQSKVLKEGIIRGERVALRKSVFDDCERFAEWESSPEVTEFFTIDDGKTYEDTVREFLEREAGGCKVQFTICLAEEGLAPIGRVYVSNVDYHYDSLDITRIYIARRAMRGQGYGEESLWLTLKWAFEDMGANRVTLDHFDTNAPAAGLYEKMGFVREGTMRSAGKKNGRYVNLRLMSMLKEEYFALKP